MIFKKIYIKRKKSRKIWFLEKNPQKRQKRGKCDINKKRLKDKRRGKYGINKKRLKKEKKGDMYNYTHIYICLCCFVLRCS